MIFSSRISITFEKDIVRFTREGEILELKPEVYLDQNDPPRVLSVGSPPSGQVASRVVHLFDGNDYKEDKVLILEAFIRFGFQKLLGGRFLLPPKVTFEAAPEIVAGLGGYHRLVLHHCAMMAGAVTTPYEKKYGRVS